MPTGVERDAIRFVVNGRNARVRVHPLTRLLDTLRSELGLLGVKEGCGEGECGACSVLVDGELVNSCLVPTLQVEGCAVTTIEGLAPDGRLHRLQACFMEHGGAQCGICTPGMILASAYLLSNHPNPSLDDVREGLSGNLCRCTGYMKIFDAVLAAAKASTGADDGRPE